MLTAVVSWCVRNYGERLDPSDLPELARLMLDMAYDDLAHWQRMPLRALADASGVAERARLLETL